MASQKWSILGGHLVCLIEDKSILRKYFDQEFGFCQKKKLQESFHTESICIYYALIFLN